MSEFREHKSRFLWDVAQHGWYLPADIPDNYELLSSVPPALLAKWLHRFYKLPSANFLKPGRLVNHWLLGADPEFALVDGSSRKCNVYQWPLHTGLAYGADNCGRLVEIRPTPSRYALDVVASCWAALRWMAFREHKADNYEWQAEAFIDGDGIGGHIHFGRRQHEQLFDEVRALNNLNTLLYDAGIFDQIQIEQRRQGTHYGREGDIRVQKHGYEYRSSPTFLSNPWQAYFILVVSKLAVLYPKLLYSTPGKTAVLHARRRLRALLAYGAPRDDDAALALAASEARGFPKPRARDFRADWGLDGPLMREQQPTLKVSWLPRDIPPTAEERTAFVQYLLENRQTLPVLPLQPTWAPTTVPAGFLPAMSASVSYHGGVIGEALAEYVTSEAEPVSLYPYEAGGVYVLLSKAFRETVFAARLDSAIRRLAKNNYGRDTLMWQSDDSTSMWRLGLSNWFLQDKDRLQPLVDSGLLPLWPIADANPAVLAKWAERRLTLLAKPKTPVGSQILYGDPNI